MEEKNLTSLSEFIDKEVGKRGTKKRDKFEANYDALKLGVLIQQARQEKGLTHRRNVVGIGRTKILSRPQ